MVSEKDYTDVLLEDINSKFDAVLDAVGGMQGNVKKIPGIVEKAERLEDDMATVKLVTKETNHDVKNIKVRVEKIDKQIDELEEKMIVLEAA